MSDVSLLLKKLLALATFMRDCAADMEYYAGFDEELKRKAGELRGAASITEQWALALEDLDDDDEGSGDTQAGTCSDYDGVRCAGGICP